MNEQLFIRQCIITARTLPIPEAINFLRGMLTLCGDSEATAEVRLVFTQLSESDRQLQLIQIGQLKLNLDNHNPPTRTNV